MIKLLLASILIASIVIPFSAAADASPSGGLRKVLVRSALFMLGYSALLRFVYPRLF